MGLPYRSFILLQGAELITEALRMEEVLWDSYHKRCSGDFATNIASGRYHAPVIRALLMRFLMENHCERWMSMSMEVVIQMKWLKRCIKNSNKEPNVHYKVGAFMQKFSIVLKRILPDKIYEKC
jgi:hypothetical protein